VSLPFLFEIGVEEIPDWMIPDALENLRLLFEKLEIPHESVTLDATPRRLVLRAEGLPARQADSQERVLGPAKSAPPRPSRLRAQAGRETRRPRTESTPKGEYYTFVRKVPAAHQRHPGGGAPRHHPPDLLPKTMYWTGKSGPRFIRPSAGSWPCSAKKSCPSSWPACARALSVPATAGWEPKRSPSRPPIMSSGCAIISSFSPPRSGATASATGWPASG